MVEIRPKVPISAVLFLVSYACELVSWREDEPEMGESAGLVDLVALMLARSIERSTRRGLLHGYRTEDAALPAPRGRICFDEFLRRRLGHSPPIDVSQDEFTADILENQLLLAALRVVERTNELARTRREINRAQRLFGGVTERYFSSAAVPSVVSTRLNRHYQPALDLATLVLRATSVDLRRGTTRVSAFLIDMNAVFERFVRVALRRSLGEGRHAFPDQPPRVALDAAGLVRLKPDLCLVRGQRITWVGDAKYKRLPAGAYRHADLYQLLAYATALRLPGGTLVYAASREVREAVHVVPEARKRLRVVALDLAAPPRALLAQIDRLAADIRFEVADGVGTDAA